MQESTKNILIVDDSITNLQVIGKMLEKESLKVTFVESALDALDLMKNDYTPDVILLDIMMPGMNGFEFKTILNSNIDWISIPVIVISALQEQDNKTMAFELGCVDFMVKPINKVEVLHRIKVQLSFKEQESQLKLINAELVESNKSRDKIFSIISHDLRTSIGNIRNVFKFIIDGLIDPEEDIELINDAEITARNTYNLLDNLLYWAKSQQGQIVYRPELVNLSRLISSLSEIEKGSMVNKDIEYNESVPQDLFVWSDKVLLTITLRNLLVNAIKFTPKGGRVSVIGQQLNDKIKISVIDSGIGISEENLMLLNNDKVFTTIGTSNEKGTGLGLVLVRDYIKICKGSLEVKSKLGQGSDFSILLPLGEE